MCKPSSLAPNICHVVPTAHPVLRRPWVVYVCNEALHVISNVNCRDALDVNSLHTPQPFVSKSFRLFCFVKDLGQENKGHGTTNVINHLNKRELLKVHSIDRVGNHVQREYKEK